MATLTKAQILEKGKARYEEVDIEQVGRVGIQSISELAQSRRDSAAVEADGSIRSGWRDRVRAYAIIDQLCTAPGQPMFTEADLEAVLEIDHKITRRLFAAIQAFNGEEDPKKKDASGD